MSKYLSRNPQICFSKPKEPHDITEFGDVFSGKNKLYASNGSEIYR